MFQIFSQRDPQWAGHALGSGAGEMGPYGCLETDFTMIAYDAYGDMHFNPASMDDTFWNAGVFSGDLLPDNALDRAWPDRFQTHTEQGYNATNVMAAVNSPDTYVIVCIHNPAVGVSAYHFMIMAGDNLVFDPWWGKPMAFSSWGGPSVAVKTIFVRSLAKERAAAQAAQAAAQAAAVKAAADAAAAKSAADIAAAKAAAQAAADKAAADAAAAKAAADQAAAKAAADAAAVAAAKAVADAKAKADAVAAQAAADAAAADAREAAAQAAADVSSRSQVAAQPLTGSPQVSFEEAIFVLIQRLLIALGKQLGGK
jgi:hypothetical protein